MSHTKIMVPDNEQFPLHTCHVCVTLLIYIFRTRNLVQIKFVVKAIALVSLCLKRLMFYFKTVLGSLSSWNIRHFNFFQNIKPYLNFGKEADIFLNFILTTYCKLVLLWKDVFSNSFNRRIAFPKKEGLILHIILARKDNVWTRGFQCYKSSEYSKFIFLKRFTFI